MSTYEERLENVKKALIQFIMKNVKDEYENHNGAWFERQEFYEIAEAYVDSFSKEFQNHMTPSFRDKLWFAGQNVAYAIHTFCKMYPGYALIDLLRFVHTFVSEQLEDFDNWSHEFTEHHL